MQKGGATSGRGNASGLTVGIAAARFNGDITEALLAAARDELRAWRVEDANVHIVRVAGSFELPFACQHLIRKKKADAIVALGCIVKGKTEHDAHLAQAVFSALQHVSCTLETPIGLGVLTVHTFAEAMQRAEYGSAAAAAALEAALL